MQNREIRAKELVADIRAGSDYTALMEKYAISFQTLHEFVGRLLDAKLLQPREAHRVLSCPDKTLDSVPSTGPEHIPGETAVAPVWKCLWCGKPQTRGKFELCPLCDVKAEHLRQRSEAEHKAPSGEGQSSVLPVLHASPTLPEKAILPMPGDLGSFVAKMKIQAGDFGEVSGSIYANGLSISTGLFSSETIAIGNLEIVEEASEETIRKVWGMAGWGAAGLIALGPVGLLAGLLLGGRKKEITFVAKFRDGRKFMATTDGKGFAYLRAARL
jgi:hypothetical protein